MPYKAVKNGNSWEVVNTSTGEVHKKFTSQAKAREEVRLLKQKDRKPDHVTTLSNGARVNVYFKGRQRSSSGKAQ